MDRAFLSEAVTALVSQLFALVMLLWAFRLETISKGISQFIGGGGFGIAIFGLVEWLIYATPYIK